jgi:adenylate cyclase
MERRLSAILAADVVGYSALMEQDEAGTFDRLRAHRKELFEPEVQKHHGRIFKLTGDGLFAEFASVVDAVECAVSLQRGLAERNANVAEEQRIDVRIGINLGEVIVEGDDRFGEGVNIAARLQQLADPGGVLVSGKVAKEVEKRLAFGFESLGEQRMKNISEPIVCYRVLTHRETPSQFAARSTKQPSPSNKTTIAVLPFLNMSGDPEQEYFSDGITEDLITDLSKISSIAVIARNTVFVYKNRPSNLQQTARELGVRYLLEGSVRKAGTRIRVTSQLIDGRDGTHLWAERYDRELTDIFVIQDEITHAIIDQLKVKLLPAEQKAVAAVPTVNVEAYTYFLKGRQFLHMWSKRYAVLARQMFAKAAELDPTYARAYAGIADCDAMLYLWHQGAVTLEGILEASAKALSLDNTLAEAHASRGVALQCVGRKEEAIIEFERALALDPQLYEANYFYGRFFFAHRDFEKAVKLFERASQIRPDDYHSPLLLNMALEALGRKTEADEAARLAVERAERELAIRPDNAGAAGLGAGALARLGERDRAKDWAARALALEPEGLNHVYNVACVYSQLGEFDLAIDLMEKVVPHRHHPDQVAWFYNDPYLDPIRNHPRYPRLLELMGSKPRSS